MENKVVNASMMPSLFPISVTEYSMNIGIVVNKGAQITQTISAVAEIFASS